MYLRETVVLALLFGAMGCAKMSSASESPDYYGYEESYGGDGGGAMDMDMAAPAMEMEVAEADSAQFSRASARRERRMAKRDSAPTRTSGSVPPEPEPGAAPGDGDGAEPAVADDTQDHGRHIIYTATMQVSVFNLEDAKAKAEALPGKYGGFVQNMSGTYFVLRIPADKLRPAMDELAGLGVVDNRTLDAQDVTEEFLDIETRIEVLEATQKQMMELLTKARTVEEALKVRQSLDQITMELEVLKGRLRRLASLISMSTLTLNLVERGPHTPTPSSNDPFPWVDELGVEATEWR